MKRSANISQRRGQIIVHPWAFTTMGVLVASEPYRVLSGGVSNEDLGDAVLRALAEAGETILHPAQDQWDAVSQSFLNAAGVASWRAYMKGARSCDADRSGDDIVIKPSRNDGRGFEGIKGAEVRIPNNSVAEVVGRAARQALDMSE